MKSAVRLIVGLVAALALPARAETAELSVVATFSIIADLPASSAATGSRSAPWSARTAMRTSTSRGRPTRSPWRGPTSSSSTG